MDLIALLAALSVLGAIVMGMVAIHRATANPRSKLERRLGGIMGGDDSAEAAVAAFEGLRTRRTGRFQFLSALSPNDDSTNDLALELEQADIKLTVSEFIAVRLFLGSLGLGVPLLLLGTTPVGILVGLVAGLVGYMLPKFYMARGKSKRSEKISDQLPDMLTMLANSLKSGFGLMQSMDLVARELQHPVATDIRRMLQDVHVGSSAEDALQSMARRSGNADLDIVVTAMLIQQSTGGNLAEILETVGHTMRERIRIRGEIKTLTTQQVMTGFIIGGLPIFIGAAVFFLNPDYVGLLFTRTVGQIMLAGGVLMELMGIFAIKRILNIEV